LTRVYNDHIQIDPENLKDFYKKRAKEKISIDIDAPVVLCGDRDKSKIGAWTTFELENRFPLLSIDRDSVVLEVGCGTGRISKYITSVVDTYVGVDYVKEFIDIVQLREDIEKKESTYFIHSSIQELANGSVTFPVQKNFNRFIISGGVFMYINDDEVKDVLGKLIKRFDKECIIYLSEPIALKERLTLNNFYSEDLENEYSAIYRTEEEYVNIFDILFKEGFELKVSEEFFYDDIKNQKETKQWMFILHRNEAS